jgi:formylglycine-generating enzyme required for sulfatase activity
LAPAVAIGLTISALVGSSTSAVASTPRVHMTWVRIGDPGNVPDKTVMASDRTTGYGSVPYAYRIGKYDVTNAQYVVFLNAVASKADPHLLFFPCMNRAQCYHEGSGIAKTGSPGDYHYAPQPGRAKMPVNYVNLFSAMRFANWMDNGQGDGSTEHGAYLLAGNGIIPTNLLNIHRTPGATVFLPSENEWYKAAYFDPRMDRYYDYPARLEQADDLRAAHRHPGQRELRTDHGVPQSREPRRPWHGRMVLERRDTGWRLHRFAEPERDL